ncbi:MAG TPA: YtfJ family protein [Spirochaetota bacterium]|nr:YtfJ family protein [Spirochaetota bacterium]HPJ38803.1 YtfJ family protein [Spirochaetota bacterium]HPQ52158.1 YtfJ family protein [Spirochaetota bacterium]
MIQKKRRMQVVIMVALAVLVAGSFTVYVNAASVGQRLSNVQLFDSNNNPGKWIPDMGRKVLTVFYVDPDNQYNESVRDALKAQNLDKSKYRGMGVVNLDDTWKPNSVVRVMIRKKERKFNSVVLTDPSHILQKAWNLGNCNDKDVVIVIGKDRVVKYISNQPVRGAELQKLIDIVKAEMAK